MSRSPGSSWKFAPGATTIAFCPSLSTATSATPVVSWTRFSLSRFTPELSSSARASDANSSSPTHAMRSTSAPRRAAATAWFAPLPPGTRLKVAPDTDSPARGKRSTVATRSRLTDPTTVRCGDIRGNLGDGQDAQVLERLPEQVVAQVEQPGPQRRAVERQLDARGVGEAF